MRLGGPRGQAIARAAARRALASACEAWAWVIKFAAMMGFGLAGTLSFFAWLTVVAIPFRSEGLEWEWAWSALALGALASWGWRDRGSVAERMAPGAPGALKKGLEACVGAIKLMAWRAEMWLSPADAAPLEEGQRAPRAPFKPGFPEWPGRAPGFVAGSVSECVEPVRASGWWAWGVARQLHLAIPTMLLGAAGAVGALCLAPLAALEAWALGVKRGGAALSLLGGGLLLGFSQLSWAVFAMSMALAVLPWMAGVGESWGDSWRWASAALLSGSLAGVLWAGRGAPGAFGPGWGKAPATAIARAAMWALVNRIFEPDARAQEALRAMTARGRGWRALGLAVARAPASCLRGVGTLGGMVWLMLCLPGWGLEWALSRALKAGASVASGRAPDQIKARLEELSREGAADFARAERSALEGLAGAGREASVKKAAPRL